MDPFIKVRAKQDRKIKSKIKQLLKTLKDSQKELIKEISSILALNLDKDKNIILDSIAISNIHSAISGQLNKLNKAQKKIVEGALIDAYAEAYTETSNLLELAIDYSILRPEFVSAAVNTPINGQRFSSTIWKNTNELANRIYDDVIEIVRTGKRPDEVARAIKNEYGRTAYEAKRLVHTELAKTVNTAQLEVYRKAGVPYVLWSATLESNTCPKCADLDGQVFPLDDVPDLPLHPNCRCALIPKREGYMPKMRADNENKKRYMEYVTYNEWKN